MSSNIFPAVTGYTDGEQSPVEAETLNQPINQLRQRTDYLFSQLQTVIGQNAFETVRLQDVDLASDDTPVVGDLVYFDVNSKTYGKAVADSMVIPTFPYTYADDSSFAIGIITTVSGLKGTLSTYGKVALTDVTAMVETDAVFRDGPYYASTSQPGKVTTEPKDIAVYIGFIIKSETDDSGYVLLAPQLKDMWEAHLHRRFNMDSTPAASFEVTGTDPDDIHYIRGIAPDTPGTLPVNLYLLGPWAGTGNTTYTIKLEGGTTELGAYSVRWKTDDGSDDSAPGFDDPAVVGFDADYGWSIGTPVGMYQRAIPIGSKGLYVVLEQNDAFADYPTADFINIPSVIEAERTWTLALPSRIMGWLGHTVTGVCDYAGTGTAPDYRLIVFGQYTNPNTHTQETITVDVAAGGDFAADTVDLTISDIDGNILASPTGVGISDGGLVQILAGSADLALWLMVTPYQENGLKTAALTAALTDSWTFEFTDEAPGAKFDYNIEMDPAFNAYYPPKPIGGVVVEQNGVTLDYRDQFESDQGTYEPGLRTLFWYPDYYGRAPYPDSWSATVPVEEYLRKNMVVYFTHRRVAESGIVTSLSTPADSGVTLLDRHTGLPAIVGDLEIIAQINFDLESSNLAGYKVVKGVGANGALQTGPVVERITAGTNCSVESTDDEGHGTVKINVLTAGITLGEFSDVSLHNAKQKMLPGSSLYGYTELNKYTTGGSNIPSSFSAQMRVPYALGNTYRMVLYMTLFGTVTDAAKAYAGMKLTYSVLQDYTSPGGVVPEFINKNLITDILETSHIQNVPFGLAVGGYTAYDPFLLHSDPTIPEVEGATTPQFYQPFPLSTEVPAELTAGDLVAIRFERSDVVGGLPEYTDEVGFISMKWKLIDVS